jgi:hypothetical protein
MGLAPIRFLRIFLMGLSALARPDGGQPHPY